MANQERNRAANESHRVDHTSFRIPPELSVRLDDFDPRFTGGFNNKAHAQKALEEDIANLRASQDVLWASGTYAVLIIFQAMDAAGKDSVIKHVMSGVNPQGCDVHSFGPPSEEERQHHFLWRATTRLPPFGRIGIFNRSYYEEVLVVRVHPELLEQQWLSPGDRAGERNLQAAPHRDHSQDAGGAAPKPPVRHELWEQRYREINDFERTLCDNGTVVIKFFLNVSREKQRKRFLKRLNRRDKYWKFSAKDIRERAHWDEYMHAYEDMLGATSTTWAPWYVIPADKKWFTRACVADIIASRIAALRLAYPQPTDAEWQELQAARKELESEKPLESS